MRILNRVLLVVLVLIFICSNVYSENKTWKNGSLYVNDNLIETTDSVWFDGEIVLLPFRTIIESLSGVVSWYPETENIIVYLDEVWYWCYIKTYNPDYVPEYFFVMNLNDKEDVYLTPMSSGGAFEMINDRVYLYEEGGTLLFEALGCTVEIDKENYVVRITSQ